MKEIDDFLAKICEKNAKGELTVGESIFGYLRLLEGDHAGRVIIKTCAKIDGEDICFFANGLTWIYTEKLKDVRCERTSPLFSEAKHSIDRSKATWYNDNGSEPQGHKW